MQAPFGGAQSAANAAMDTPSNKLFFAGLPDSLTEETFRAMMEKFPGFEAARLRHDRAGQWVGFVDFKEESEATACKNAMAGAKLDPNNSALVTVRYSGQKAKASGLGPLGAGPGMGAPGAPGVGGPLSAGKRPFEPAFVRAAAAAGPAARLEWADGRRHGDGRRADALGPAARGSRAWSRARTGGLGDGTKTAQKADSPLMCMQMSCGPGEHAHMTSGGSF